MARFQVEIIHPTPAAEFSVFVYARSKTEARNVTYRKINDRFGANTLHMIGNITKRKKNG